MPRPCSLYTIAHRETGRSYVGITVDTKKRWRRHWWDARQGCDTYIGHALRCYGREAFDWEVVAVFVDSTVAKEAEKLAIAEGYGHFNLSPGGDWNPGPSDEARARMSAATKGIPKSPETVARMSAAQMGHTVTEEWRKNLSESHKGYVMPVEQRAKISASNKGKHDYLHTPEIHAKAAASLKGRVSPNKGKPMSDEQKKKLSAANTGRALSDEHKQKVSIAITAVWAKRKQAKSMRDMAPTQER